MRSERNRAYRQSAFARRRGGWEQPVGLLWIDGDHRYESVRQDLECWEPHLEPGALVALHDFTDPNLGPQQAIREALQAGRFEQVELVRFITVLRRRACSG